MGFALTNCQCTEIFVNRNQNAPILKSVGKNCFISWIAFPITSPLYIDTNSQ